MDGQRARKRLTALATMVVVAAPVVVAATTAPAQAADTFTCSGPGSIFAHGSDGLQYRYPLNNPGTTSVAHGNRSGETGRSWTTYPKVVGGANGRIYGINAEGLWQYRWNGSGYTPNPATGEQRWKISPSFTMYATSTAFRNRITVDEIGDIYLVDAAGALRWYRYNESTAAFTFNRVIDQNWLKYDLIVAAGPGVLYSRTTAGELYRSRFEPVSQRWIVKEQRIADGTWNNFTKGITSNGGDTLNGIQADGDFFHYRWVEDENRWAVPGVDFGNAWQNYANVYPLTDTCKLTDRKTPARPANPVQPDNPTAMIQPPAEGTALAPLVYAYIDGVGKVQYGNQPDPDQFGSIEWSTVPGGQAYSGRPSLVLNPDDKVRMFLHGTNSDAWSSTRSGTIFGAVADLGGALKSRPVAIRQADNSTLAFGLDESGALWGRPYDTVTKDLQPWRKLGGTGLTGELVLTHGSDGKVSILALDADGTPVTATYQNGTLSAWTGLGGSGFTATPAVVRLPGSILEVFARDADGRIQMQKQVAAGTFPGTWTPVGDFVSAGAPAAVLDPQTSRIAIFARGQDDEIYWANETGAGAGRWGDWADILPAVADPSITDPTVTEYRGRAGDSYLITFRAADDAHRVYTRNPGTTGKTARSKPAFTAHRLPAPRP